MSKTNYISIIDFGSSKITVLVGEKLKDNVFNILGSGEIEYDGFYQGKFIEPGKLKSAVYSAIALAEDSSGITIEELHVGVPGEFTSLKCAEGSIAVSVKNKIREEDVNKLINRLNTFKDIDEYKFISCSPIYFTLDDNVKVIDPVGRTSQKLGGIFSYFLANKNFILPIDNLFAGTGRKILSYIPSVLAEAMFLFEPKVRDQYAILMDVGYLTTNIMLVRGEGLLHLKSYPLGGAHLTTDLFEILEIDNFKDAELLKRRIDLNLQPEDNDTYDIRKQGEIKSFNMKFCNRIVTARLRDFVKILEKAFSECQYDFPEDIVIYLTGNGISHIRGAKEYLTEKLGVEVRLVLPPVPQLNKPQFSSSIGVLNYAVKKEVKKLNILDKIMSILNGGNKHD